jgi:hypothetical protein
LRERWEIWDRLALRTDLVLAERPTVDAGRDDQMCAGSAGQSVRRSVSWPAAHRIRAARRWLICALCAARVRCSAARSLPGVAGNAAPFGGERPGEGDVLLVRHWHG